MFKQPRYGVINTFRPPKSIVIHRNLTHCSAGQVGLDVYLSQFISLFLLLDRIDVLESGHPDHHHYVWSGFTFKQPRYGVINTFRTPKSITIDRNLTHCVTGQVGLDVCESQFLSLILLLDRIGVIWSAQ